MLKEYTTKKIMELCEECGNDKKFMKKVWIAKDYITDKCNLWDTDDIRGSSETKSGDKWLFIDKKH